MFGRKLKTQKENVISAQEETLDMHPVIHVADSIIEYQKQLAEREVESLDEMADIQKAFVLATKENERLKDQVQELSSVFADVGQIATSFDGVKNEIVDSVGEAQQKIDELKNSSKEVSRSFEMTEWGKVCHFNPLTEVFKQEKMQVEPRGADQRR